MPKGLVALTSAAMASKKKRTPPRPRSGSRPQGKAAPKAPRERTGPTRAERLAAAEAARRRKATRTRVLISGGLVAVLALLTVTIINSRRSNDAVVDKLEASGACSYDTAADPDAGAGNNHISGDITYKVNPPAGGDHNPSPSPPGIFTADTTPPDPRIVHSLEHGYVAIWYRPDIGAAALADLQSLANRYIKDVLLMPRPALTDEPVAATAWHRRLLCQRPDTDALERFITAYRNKGPEKVPHD